MNRPGRFGGTWPPRRRWLSACALAVALVTASATAWTGLSGREVFSALIYVATVAAAIYSPAWITVQVIGGQIMAASLLLGPGAMRPVAGIPIIAAVIATAELLAAAARLDTPFARANGGEVRRTTLAAAIGGAVFGAVALAGGVPGPTGLIAVTIASAGCLFLGLLLFDRAPRP